jgi:hypothetical protein
VSVTAELPYNKSGGRVRSRVTQVVGMIRLIWEIFQRKVRTDLADLVGQGSESQNFDSDNRVLLIRGLYDETARDLRQIKQRS